MEIYIPTEECGGGGWWWGVVVVGVGEGGCGGW